MSYSILEHSAELKIHVEGRTRQELFSDAVLGMMSVMKRDRKNLEGIITRKISLGALDETALLVDFLNEVLLRSHMYKEVYIKVSFSYCDEIFLEAELEGVPIEKFDEDVRVVAYYEADVQKNERDNWETEISFILDNSTIDSCCS